MPMSSLSGEIRAIGRKPQHRMSLSLQRIQRVLPFVEGGVIHTVRTGDVFSEAAFIDINEWMQACFIDTFYFGEFTAFFFVCLAVAEVFFLTVKR